MGKRRKPTAKQELAIQQLLKDPSLVKCAEVTGYHPVYVRELVRKDYIIEILEEKRAELAKMVAEKTGIDAAWVLKRQVEVLDRCMQKEPVMEKVDGEWVPTGEWKFDAAGANKALRNIGDHKAVQAFTPDSGMPTVPEDVEWTVKVVHMTKDDYDRQQSQEKEKPPIEHRP